MIDSWGQIQYRLQVYSGWKCWNIKTNDSDLFLVVLKGWW